MKRLFVCVLATIAAAGCTAHPSRPPRPAVSSLGCMHRAIDARLPKTAPDKELHCLAAGFIARYCSSTEARIAGAGKEIRDLFTPHETAEWADWRADLKGIHCAQQASTDDDLSSCCRL